MSEVQGVYKSQGVEIHDKHVEVIVRQMLRRVTVIESGDTDLLPGELVDNIAFQTANRKALVEGKKPAAGRPEMMGITKASLATESLAVGGLLPGDHPRPDSGCYGGED